MASRRLLSTLLVALMLLLAASPGTASGTSSSSSSGDSDRSRNATAVAVTVSSCELCRDHGQCDQAYMGSPGMFCGAHLTAVACCCPAGGVCLRSSSSSDCACGSKPSSQSASVKDQQGASGVFGGTKIAWTVLTALVMCVLIAVYLYTTRGDRSYHYREPRRVPAAQTTTTTTQRSAPSHPRPATASAALAPSGPVVPV